MKGLPLSPEHTPSPGAHSNQTAIAARRDEAQDFLLDRINYERSPASPYAQRTMKLDRMRTLLTRLGNPDAGLPIVHVAGTKGKGSTSTMIAHMLHAAGYDVGVFTSPHLENIEERFVVNNIACSAETFADLVGQVRPILAQLDAEALTAGEPGEQPTFFEVATAIALQFFSQRKVDAAVLEVGLGGRLDATNVCQSIVSIITSISLDHTRQLGTTLEQIAREKAGIIKPGVPVVVGPMDEGPLREIEQIAAQHGARTLLARRDFDFRYIAGGKGANDETWPQLDFLVRDEQRLPELDAKEFQAMPLGLWGGHQGANAALALAALGELRRQGWRIATDAMRGGLAQASLPGRIEIVRRRPAIVLDVAHNTASAAALVKCLDEIFAAKRRRLVFAATRDKDVRGIARILLPHFDEIYVTAYCDNPRGVTTERLVALCREELTALGRDPSEAQPAEDPREAWRWARSATHSDDLLCVAGSFFLAAELRAEVCQHERSFL